MTLLFGYFKRVSSIAPMIALVLSSLKVKNAITRSGFSLRPPGCSGLGIIFPTPFAIPKLLSEVHFVGSLSNSSQVG